MTPELLYRVGVALYGEMTFKARLADELGVAVRTVQRWCVGTEPIPSSIGPELLALVQERGRAVADLKSELIEANHARHQQPH